MKKKFLAILLGAILAVSMLPVGIMADVADDTNLLKHDGTFTSVSTNELYSFYEATSGQRGIITDPEDPENKVLVGYAGTDDKNSVNFPIKDETEGTRNDFFKVTFRFYVPTQEGLTGTYTFPLDYRHNGAAQRGTNRIRMDISSSVYDEWLDFEAYVTPFKTTSITAKELVFSKRAFDVYFDDFKVELVTDKGFVTNRGLGASSKIANASQVQDSYYSHAYGRIVSENDAISAVQPLAFFVPEAAGDSALAIAQIYKVEGDTRTLEAIKLTPLTATDTAPVYTDADFNLDDYTIGEGEYIVEYLLWELDSLAPITGKRTFAAGN